MRGTWLPALRSKAIFDINGLSLQRRWPERSLHRRIDDPASGACTGQANVFPNYLLGLPDTYGQGSAQDELVRSRALYLFAQDSWKLRSNLTLNYGLRWELNTRWRFREKSPDISSPVKSHLSTRASLKRDSVAKFQALGVAKSGLHQHRRCATGLVVPGDTGIPGGLTATYYNPSRRALVWLGSPDSKTDS